MFMLSLGLVHPQAPSDAPLSKLLRGILQYLLDAICGILEGSWGILVP